MTALVPALITQKAMCGVRSGSFQAQVLSLDIVGFSEMASTLMNDGDRGAETLAKAMNDAFAPIISEITEGSGEVVAITGDCVTAVFPKGTPESIDSCAIRLIELVSTKSTVPLAARVGIATGKVRWFISDEVEGERIYGFDGPTMVRAAKAQSAAKPQSVLREPEVESADLQPKMKLEQTSDASAPAQIFLPLREIEARGVGQFRHVVVAFIRLPDEIDETRMQEVLSHVLALRQRFGGVSPRLDCDDKGQTLLLFWGAPLASERDRENALGFLNTLRKRTDVPLQIGAAFGMVFAGLIGGSERADYTCYGKVTNLAVRLMSAAEIGIILVDDALAKASSASFDFGRQRTLDLKGFPQPVPCHELDGQRAAALVQTSDHIGREALLSGVLSSLSAVDTSLALLVEGEPGIGKSHFLRELHQRTGAQPWIVAQCDPRLGSAFAPVRQLIEGLIGPFETRSELNQALKISGVETAARNLWPLLPGEGADEPLDTGETIGRVSEGLIAVAQAGALRQRVLSVEDVHWLDSASAQVLTGMIARQRRPGSPPTKIVMTTRPGPGKLGPSAKVERLGLPLLKGEETGALLANLLEGPVSRRLADRIQEIGQGNPLFVQQLALLLREAEAIAQQDGMWRLQAGKGNEALPTDVRSLLVARIDGLSDAARRVVSAASIFGRVCDVRGLEALLNGAVPNDAMTELAEAEILDREGADRLSFHHALLADTAYDMQLTSERALLHLQVYERLCSDDAADAEKARHADGAGKTALAIGHYRRAAETANMSAQPEMASSSILRALELAGPEDHRLKFELLQELDMACTALSDLHRRDWVISQLEELVETIGVDAEVAVAVATAKQMEARREYHELLRYMDEISDRMADIASPKDQVALLIEHSMAQMYIGTESGFARSVELAFDALKIAKETGDTSSILFAHRLVALVHRYARDDIAREHFEIALSLSNSPRDRVQVKKSYASVLMRQGETKQAMQHYSEVLDYALEAGALGMELVVRQSIGHAALDTGAFKEANEQAKFCASLGPEIGNMYSDRNALLIRIHAKIQLGHLSEALALSKDPSIAALKQDATGESLQFFGALALDLLGQYDAAIEEFQKMRARAASEGRWLDVGYLDLFLIQARARIAPGSSVAREFEQFLRDLPNTQMTSRFVFHSRVLEDRRIWMLAAQASHLVTIGRAADVSASDVNEVLAALDEHLQQGARLDGGPGRNLLSSRWADHILTALEGIEDPRYDQTLAGIAAAMKSLGDLVEPQGFERGALWAEDVVRQRIARRASDAGLEF